MHMHLSNCHGEWNVLAMLLTNGALVLPLVVAYFRSFFARGGE